MRIIHRATNLGQHSDTEECMVRDTDHVPGSDLVRSPLIVDVSLEKYLVIGTGFVIQC